MASSAASLLLSALLLPSVRGDVFSHVQPLDTVILGQYNHSEPVYPSREFLPSTCHHIHTDSSPANATGIGWEDALVRAQAFVAELTLQEKTDMVTGTPGPCVGNILAVPRLGFPGLCLQDGPLALRNADYTSVFSAGVAIAATWDKDIMYERGNALGKEFKAKGSHIYLG